MNPYHLAPAALRYIIFAEETGELGISNFNVSEMPDGAEAFAVSTRTPYRLNKDLTGSTIAGVQIAAAGGGLWVAISSGSGSGVAAGQYAYWARATTSGAVATTTDWSALDSGVGMYAGLGSSAFSISTSTGVVTYNGAQSFDAMVTVQISLRPTTADKGIEVAISLNGAFIGGASVPNSFARQNVVNGDRANIVVLQLFQAIETGDTLQPIIRVGATTDTTDVEVANMMVQPAGL